MADATVVVEPLPAGILPAPDRASPLLRLSRTARTDETGRYRFDGLGGGAYRLRVTRMGYRPATVEVEVRGGAGPRLSLGLEVEAVALEPLEVRATTTAIPADARSSEDSLDLRALERWRRERFVASDVQAVAPAQVRGLSLGETDVLRALQRTPGVSARDFGRAEIWTRGAPWHQTQVTFDGVPLLDPVRHDGGRSAVDALGLGTALVHRGVTPASIRGGAAGTVELRTRRGDPSGAHGAAALSLDALRAAADGPLPGGRGSWMLTGRHSGWIERLAGPTSFGATRVPTGGGDLAGRLDLVLGTSGRVEASGIMQTDEGEWQFGGTRETQRWSVAAGQAAVVLARGGWMLRQGAQYSRTRFHRGYPQVGDTLYDDWMGSRYLFTQRAAEWSYAALTGEVSSPAPRSRRPEWRFGYALERRDARSRVRPLAYPDRRYLEETRLDQASVWARARWAPTPLLALDGGVRVDVGGELAGTAAVRPTPSLTVRLGSPDGTTLSLGYGERYQYTQMVSLEGEEVAGPAGDTTFVFTTVWSEPFRRAAMLPLVAGDRTPPIHTRILTAGMERWVADAWLASLNVYLRRSTGVVSAGNADDGEFATAADRAWGAEASLRRLVGRWTASVAYTFSRSYLEDADGVRLAPQDRPHAIDLDLSGPLIRRVRLNLSASAMSGAPNRARIIWTGEEEARHTGAWMVGASLERRFELFGAHAVGYAGLRWFEHPGELRGDAANDEQGALGLRVAF